jgi:hypothetical protein
MPRKRRSMKILRSPDGGEGPLVTGLRSAGSLVEKCPQELQQFVIWLLGKARHYAEYFTSSYRFTSFVVYAYGRPRFEVCARLASEVDNAAIDLGINVPDDARLTGMPNIGHAGFAVQFASMRRAKKFVRNMQDRQD